MACKFFDNSNLITVNCYRYSIILIQCYRYSFVVIVINLLLSLLICCIRYSFVVFIVIHWLHSLLFIGCIQCYSIVAFSVIHWLHSVLFIGCIQCYSLVALIMLSALLPSTSNWRKKKLLILLSLAIQVSHFSFTLQFH